MSDRIRRELYHEDLGEGWCGTQLVDDLPYLLRAEAAKPLRVDPGDTWTLATWARSSVSGVGGREGRMLTCVKLRVETNLSSRQNIVEFDCSNVSETASQTWLNSTLKVMRPTANFDCSSWSMQIEISKSRKSPRGIVTQNVK